MEMEIVKPFGDEVNSKETEVICLSKQKIKMHFFRWSVKKENQVKLDKRSLHSFPITGPKVSSSSSPESEGMVPFIDQKPLKIDIPPTDIAKYSGSPSLGPEIITSPSSTPPSPESAKPFPYLIMVPEKVFSGYLYIYHPNAEGIECYEEFYVNNESKLLPISLIEGEDVRPTAECSPEFDRYEYTAPPSNKSGESSNEIWVAFSPLQWKYSYLVTTCKGSSQRKRRMQRVVCKPLKNGQNPNAHSRMIWYFSEVWMSDVDVSREEASSMEVLLDDPIHLAEQISNIVNHELDNLARLVKSIQFGVPPDEVGLEPEKCKNKDAQYLHLLAVASYKFAFSSEDNIDTYTANTSEEHNAAVTNLLKHLFFYPNPERTIDDIDITRRSGIDKKLIRKLLAIKERDELSRAIHAYRNDLGALFISDRYQNRLDDYVYNIETRKQNGKCVTVHHLATLTKLPGVIDNHLRLNKDVETAHTDIWLKLTGLIEIGDKTIAQNTVALINADIDLENFFYSTTLEHERYLQLADGAGNTGKDIEDVVLIKLSRCVTEFAKDLTEARAAWMPTVVKPSVFPLTIDGYQTLFEVPKGANKTDIILGRNGEFIKNLLDNNQKGGITAEAKKNEIHIFTKNNKIDIQNCTIRLGGTPKKFDDILIDLVDNDHFRSIELALILLDIDLLVREATSKDPKSVLEHANGILTGAKHLSDAASIITRGGMTAPVKKLSLSSKIFAISTRVSFRLGIVTSIMDIKITLANRDYDAALAHSASAILPFVAGALGISVGWPVFLLAAGFTVLAIYLTDSELESYFKSFPLSKSSLSDDDNITFFLHENAKHRPTKPHEAVKALCDAMNSPLYSRSMEKRKGNDRSFEMYYIQLMDFFYPVKIEVQTIVSDFYSVNKDTDGAFQHKQSTKFHQGKVKRLHLSIQGLPRYLSLDKPENNLDIKFISDSMQEIIHQPASNETHFQDDKSSKYSAEFSFDYDCGFTTAYFLLRLVTSDECIPLKYKNEARYFIFKFDGLQSETRYLMNRTELRYNVERHDINTESSLCNSRKQTKH